MKPVAYSYPRNAGKDEETQRALEASGFLSGRLQTFEPDRFYNIPDDSKAPDDWFELMAVPMQSIEFSTETFDPCHECVNDNNELNPILDEALNRTAWVILVYHNIGNPNGFGWYDWGEFQKDMQSIVERDFWTAPMNDITLYAREREKASIEVEVLGSENDPERIEITVSDGLDNAVFGPAADGAARPAARLGGRALLRLPGRRAAEPARIRRHRGQSLAEAERAAVRAEPGEIKSYPRRARVRIRLGSGSSDQGGAMSQGSIEVYESEDRTFPPPPGFAAAALAADKSLYAEAEADFEAFWARQARELLDWHQGLPHHPGMGPALRPMVHRRNSQRRPQLPRPPCGRGPGRQGGLPLGGRARRHPVHHLPGAAGRRAAVRQRPAEAGPAQGRPGRHLHAHDPRAAGGHAGLRPDRGSPLGDLRRVLPRRHHRPLRGRRGQADRHRRRRLPAGGAVAAQTQRRPGPGGRGPHRGARGSGGPLRHRPGHDRGPGPVVGRPDGRVGPRLPGRAHGLRAAPVPAVHVGDHGQAQGHHAHHRRLPHPGLLHPQVRVRPPPRHRRLLVRGRHRLGDRPQLHRLRPAGQRLHLGDVRGHPRHPPAPVPGRRPGRMAQGPAVGHRRALRRHPALHRPHRHPHLHEVGRGMARRPRPVRPAGAGHGGGAHQPRGVDVVPPPHRRRALPGGGHLVADRDRRPHDLPAARRHRGQAGLGHPAPARDIRRGGGRRRRPGGLRRRPSHRHPPLAVDAAGHLGATPSATARLTGRPTRAATSPATGPGWTTTATSGCWAGWTT